LAERFTPKNSAGRRVSLYTKACFAGDPEACGTLAGLWGEPPLGNRSTLARAAPKMETLCRRAAASSPDGRACLVLGEMLAFGRGVARDPAMAAVWLDAACQFDWTVGCNERDLIRAGQEIAPRGGEMVNLPILHLPRP